MEKRAIIVDDEAATCELIEKVLTSAGIESLTVTKSDRCPAIRSRCPHLPRQHPPVRKIHVVVQKRHREPSCLLLIRFVHYQTPPYVKLKVTDACE
jgi:hypothetical protein